MVEYKLPQGTGLKKPSGKRKMTPLQYDIYKKCFDDVSGPLFFAEHCCYVKRNGLQNYSPFDYQREMLFNMHNYQNIISLWSRQNGKCLDKNVDIKIRNKTTGNIEEITIGELFDRIKKIK